MIKKKKSEERRGQEFVKKVEATVEMRSDVMDAPGKHRPNLLIIDEIDGLPASESSVCFPFLSSPEKKV